MKICTPSKTINIDRLNMMRKGYLTRTDLMRFVPCGSRKASEVYRHISSQVLSEGKDPGYFGLNVQRVLSYLHLTESQIRRFAADEERELNINKTKETIQNADYRI